MTGERQEQKVHESGGQSAACTECGQTDHGQMDKYPCTIFHIRVSGVQYHPRSTLARPYEDEYEIIAEHAGDALNELVNRSGLWDNLDSDYSFAIEVTSGSASEETTKSRPPAEAEGLTSREARDELHQDAECRS